METTRFGSCELLFCGWKLQLVLQDQSPVWRHKRAKKPFTWNFPPKNKCSRWNLVCDTKTNRQP